MHKMYTLTVTKKTNKQPLYCSQLDISTYKGIYRDSTMQATAGLRPETG